jgi:hypothetical protein
MRSVRRYGPGTGAEVAPALAEDAEDAGSVIRPIDSMIPEPGR